MTKKFKAGYLLIAMLLVSMVLVPAASAQNENNYTIAVEEAIKHADAHVKYFVAANITDFGDWKGASIDTKPLELYDINGKKLYYQFSVYKNNNIISKIDVGADKKLGASVQVIELNPKPFNADDAIKKSIEIAKTSYLTENIKSTKMVVYSYPKIGAMTVVKDKTTGNEYRIFVDAYTLDVIPDKPATEKEPGVWSMYEQRLKNGIDKNLKEWQKSDQLTKYIVQENTSGTAVTPLVSSKTLSVPLYGQETSYYCAPASGQMIAKYYGVTHTQTYIYGVMRGVAPYGVTDDDQVRYYKNGLGKSNSYHTTSFTFDTAVSEINNNRPFVSLITGHARVCRGYSDTGFGLKYLAINDPLPVGSGQQYGEAYGNEIERVYVRS